MKVCLLLSGQNRLTEETVNAMNQYLPYDTYCYFWEGNTDFVNKIENIKKINYGVYNGEKSSLTKHPSLVPMLYSLKKCYESIDKEYDIYIRFRPDLLMLDKIKNSEIEDCLERDVLYTGFYGDNSESGYILRELGICEIGGYPMYPDMFFFCSKKVSNIVFNIFDYLEQLPLNLGPEVAIGYLSRANKIGYCKSSIDCMFYDKESKVDKYVCNYNNFSTSLLIIK
jgi:hypothetical protein